MLLNNDEEKSSGNSAQVRDGDFNGNLLATLCGLEVPSPIFSTGRKLSLHSWSAAHVSYVHYDIIYTTTAQGTRLTFSIRIPCHCFGFGNITDIAMTTWTQTSHSEQWVHIDKTIRIETFIYTKTTHRSWMRRPFIQLRRKVHLPSLPKRVSQQYGVHMGRERAARIQC